MRLSDRENKYRTISGATLGICTIIIFMVFAGAKLQIMFALDDYKVQQRDYELAYTDKDPFNASDGFMIAATLSG